MSNFLNAGLIHTGSAFRLWQSAKIENTYILATRTLTLFTLAKSNAVQTKGQFSIVQDCFFVYTAIDCSLKKLRVLYMDKISIYKVVSQLTKLHFVLQLSLFL